MQNPTNKPTSKPTEVHELNSLHTLVSKVLTAELTRTDSIEVNGEMVEISTISPALIAQAIKFLKDNSITTTVEEDSNLMDLANTLQKKAKHSQLASVTSLISPLKAAHETN